MCVCVCVRVCLGVCVMRENAEDRAKKLRGALINEKLLDRFSKDMLRGVVKRTLKVSDPRTIKNCVDDLIDFRYIYKCNTASGVYYAINWEHEDFDNEKEETGKQLSITEALQGIQQ